MTNYTITSNSDITNLSLSDGAYRCYNLLQSLCFGDKTTCYPSIKYMACALGRSCRTINRYIKELVSLKLIIKRRRGSVSNLYTLVQKTVNRSVNCLKTALKGKREVGSNTKAKDAPIQGDRNSHVVNHDFTKNKKSKNYYKKKPSTFNDYTQRQYDFDKLEQALLGNSPVTEFNELLE